MPLLALGLNHQTAPLALRERVALDSGQLPAALDALGQVPGVAEAALLSTCNRTEVYAQVEEGREAAVAEWLAVHHGLAPDALSDYLYLHRDDEAVRHLFRVATGLDSLVLGEPQILGQVKDAWQAARGRQRLRSSLDRLFQQSFQVAKRVRTDTRIGAHPVSVAYASVRLARQVFSELDRATVLLVGAGDTIELAARHLVDAKARRLLVANRTLEHAQALASRHGGYALPLSELPRHLPEADIVITATASREPVLKLDAVQAALKARRHRPMFMLDLAVPRDIDPAVATLGDVYLYTVDDLEQVIEENRASRREAAEQAQAIIDLQVGHYMAWWRAQGRQDALKAMRRSADAAREQMLARAHEQLAAGKPATEVVELLAAQLTNKLLHGPSAALRQAALDGDLDLLRAAERLYQDDDDARPAP
ncbi:glutamyl-tRNA reductase [Arenimonas caeni]|jgi:glutamyl-tRNA reductase|uniref:Glutamyl-tRNA reductase n=1 Tax=Arenimonas caeni TaxID=2058085 RepID=A0A2P6M6I8_9GAMM|nr:glutamyl-tRNA reductase [Arenimonas caeni]MDY0023103.1 glutamyl-tRNA reductase [Arenimonas caeni]PRH81569.1 glutamyl-tRNA reductase [Arenimonas caeni]